MFNYLFGRMLYDLIKTVIKGFKFLFVGITYVCCYIIYLAFMTIFYLVKNTVKYCIILSKKCIILIKNRRGA